MKTKCSVNFYIEKRKDKNGVPIIKNVPIHMFFSFDSKRLIYYTGYRVDKSKWNAVEQDC